MTLAIAIQGRRSIWVAADSRLTYALRAPVDESIKIAHIGASDGTILLTYAGLGATGQESVVSNWVRMTLRQEIGTVEQLLAKLAHHTQTQFPHHLLSLPIEQRSHLFLATCLVDGEVRLYSIGFALSGDQSIRVAYRRWANPPLNRPPRVVVTGSGGSVASSDHVRARSLVRLVAAYEKGRISAESVADEIARLVFDVHKRVSTVGPHAVVKWASTFSSNSYQFYRNGVRTEEWGPIPAVGGGFDLTQIASIVLRNHGPLMERALSGENVELPTDEEMNGILRKHDWTNQPELK